MLIREARINDTYGIAKVHVDSWRTTYKGIISKDFLADLSYEKSEERIRAVFSNLEKKFVYVAENELSKIVGFIIGGYNRDKDSEYCGEIDAIYILEENQQKGIGTKLVETLFQKFTMRNISSVIVWVLPENKSRKFYENLGGKPLNTKIIKIEDDNFEVISYVWSDI